MFASLKVWFIRWRECRAEKCSYFTRYLRLGPADLTHRMFHQAEQEHVNWRWRVATSPEPDFYSEKILRVYQRQVRA